MTRRCARLRAAGALPGNARRCSPACSLTMSLTRLPATSEAFFVPRTARVALHVVMPLTRAHGTRARKTAAACHLVMARRRSMDTRAPLRAPPELPHLTSSPVARKKWPVLIGAGRLNAVVTWVSLPLHRWALTVFIVLLQSRVVEVGVTPICQNKAVGAARHGSRQGLHRCGDRQARGARATLGPSPSRSTRGHEKHRLRGTIGRSNNKT
jgi:hypothetical protein